MSRIKLLLYKVSIGVLRVSYLFLKLLPIQNKYLFLSKLSYSTPFDFELLDQALKKNDSECRTVILCQPIDNNAKYIFHMFKQMYHLATSRAVFLERSCLVVHVLNHKKSLKVIQMWHALGSMKKFGYAILDTKEGQPHELAKVFKMHKGYTSILISSYSFLDDYLEGFGVDGSTVVEIPLPRADVLVDESYRSQKRQEVIEAYPSLNFKKNILYCPTFRKIETSSMKKKIHELVEQVDFEKYNFIYSPHPMSKSEIDDPRVIQPKKTSQELLFIADFVISDYSSIIYESGLMGIPTYLYAYDWEEYHENRMHNIDLTTEVPLLFTDNPKEIIEAITNGSFDFSNYNEFIKDSIKMPQRGTCCDAIVDLVTD